MTLKVYGIKNCDTVRKALKALKEAGKELTFIDVRADGLAETTVSNWLKVVKSDTLLNKRGKSWRTLSDEDKAAAEADPASAICKAPTLFKRPVIVSANGDITVGWKPAQQEKYLG